MGLSEVLVYPNVVLSSTKHEALLHRSHTLGHEEGEISEFIDEFSIPCLFSSLEAEQYDFH